MINIGEIYFNLKFKVSLDEKFHEEFNNYFNDFSSRWTEIIDN